MAHGNLFDLHQLPLRALVRLSAAPKNPAARPRLLAAGAAREHWLEFGQAHVITPALGADPGPV